MAESKQDLLEDPQVLPGAEAALDEGEDLEEAPRLSIKQKILTALTVLLSFVVFSIIFLPMEPVARYVLRKFGRVVRVEFKTLDLSLFGSDTITDLRVTTPDGSSLRGSSVQSTVSYLGLISEQARGRITIPRLELDSDGFEAKINGVRLDLNVRRLFQPTGRWEGMISLEAASAQIGSLPPMVRNLGLDLDPATVKIRSVSLKARMESGGRLLLDNTSLASNLLNISIKGGGKIRESLFAPDLDATICLTPDRDLETTNKSLFDFYIRLGGTRGGSLCPRAKGVPGNIRWELPQDTRGPEAGGGKAAPPER